MLSLALKIGAWNDGLLGIGPLMYEMMGREFGIYLGYWNGL